MDDFCRAVDGVGGPFLHACAVDILAFVLVANQLGGLLEGVRALHKSMKLRDTGTYVKSHP